MSNLVKYFLSFLILIILVVFLIGKNSEQKYESNVIKSIQTTDIVKRDAISKDWVNSLRKEAAQTGNTQMKEVLAMIDEKTNLAIPADDGLLVADHIKPIHLMVLLPEDTKYSVWKPYLEEKGAAAWFEPNFRTIILREKTAYGPKTKAAILAHEGEHVLHYLKKGSLKASSEVEYGNEERDTYSVANSALYSFGGQAYLDFRAKRVLDIAKNMTYSDAGATISFPDETYQEIGKIIGPFASKEEIAWWVGTAWIDSTFQFIDQHSVGTKEVKDSLKSEVIIGMTQALGLNPFRQK